MLGFRGNVLLLGEAKLHAPEVLAVAQSMAEASAAMLVDVAFAEDADAGQVIEALERRFAAAILVDLNVGPLKSEDDLRRLVAAARCPVVVLGANRIRLPAFEGAAGDPGNKG